MLKLLLTVAMIVVVSSLRIQAQPVISDSFLIHAESGQQGLFYYDGNDRSSSGNGGTVIVKNGRRYKRLYSGAIDARWFGMKADWNWKTGSDNTTALMKAIAAAQHNQEVIIPEGRYYIKQSIALPLVSDKKIFLKIFGDIYFEKGSGFIIEGPNQYFRSYGLIAGQNTGASSEEAYRQYSGTGIYLKNSANCDIEVNEVKDFRYGIHLSAEKKEGSPVNCKNNRIAFNAVHHNYAQIKISVSGRTSGDGNVNNSSTWHGGQLGRGKSFSYGKGGWYGVQIVKEKNANAKQPISGHNFYDVGFEGLEKPIVIADGLSNNFIGGRFEEHALREGIDLDPETAVATAFIGQFAMVEKYFIPGRTGTNTIIDGTPIWSGTTNQVIMGIKATNSITPGKLLAISNKYGYTNYQVNKTHDLISKIGQYPTVEAMKYRINGVIYSVPYKKTFFAAIDSIEDDVIDLPPNIGLVSVNVNEAKVFTIDTGDLVRDGENFLVDYHSPAYPVTFVKAGSRAPLIPPRFFPSWGTYFCLWLDGRYKVTKIGSEYKVHTQRAAKETVAEGVLTHYTDFRTGEAITRLPEARLFPGRTITIKNLQSKHTVTIDGIIKDDDHVLGRRKSLTVASDGKSWHVIGN